MAKRSKTAVGVTVKAVPIPAALVEARFAGEVVALFGGGQDEIERAQKALALDLVDRITLYGLGGDGSVEDKVVMSFRGDSKRDIDIDYDGDRRSAIEALDGGMAKALATFAGRFRRRGLQLSAWYRYRPEVANDAERLARARAELGTAPGTPPVWSTKGTPRDFQEITPGKDPGLMVQLTRLFRN